MKKLFALALAAIILLSLAACGGAPAEGPAQEAPPPSATPAPTPSPEPTSEESTEPTPASPESGVTGSWSALYAEYWKRFDADIEAFNTGTDTVFTALKLTKGEVDLAFTASFFGPDAEASIKPTFEMFGLRDVTYTEQGDTAVAEGIDSGGDPVKIELKYDGGNTAAVYYYLNGELSMELSLCVTEAYAAKFYKSYDAEKPQTLCAIAKPNGDVWMGLDTKTLTGTLYQNEKAASDPSFATDLPESYTYVDGIFTKN